MFCRIVRPSLDSDLLAVVLPAADSAVAWPLAVMLVVAPEAVSIPEWLAAVVVRSMFPTFVHSSLLKLVSCPGALVNTFVTAAVHCRLAGSEGPVQASW